MDVEKAQIMFKLARKGNWGASYDRLEHFKRFQGLKECVKDLTKKGWIIIKLKSSYTGISLNPEHKQHIITFVETHLPLLRGVLR
jgi:hypothetical protein